MLGEIKAFFERKISVETSGDSDDKLKLATAALLIEMTQQDNKVDREEVEAVKKALVAQFNLATDELNDLFELAEKEVAEAIDYHQFTSLIARDFTQAQKIKIIEFLWSVAYADSDLNALEEHMVRKIADLIYVSHKDFIQAKHKVQDKLNG